jgi:NADH-quinone oxidoreductase subunit J
MWLVGSFFSLAAIYTLLGAFFIGIIQILVYAGAIMVVFLFVVMLLNLGHPSEIADIKGLGARLLAGAAGLALLAELLVVVRQELPDLIPAPPVHTNVVNPIAAPLFTQYLLAFEITSVLLLAAIVGAVVLAKRRV